MIRSLVPPIRRPLYNWTAALLYRQPTKQAGTDDDETTRQTTTRPRRCHVLHTDDWSDPVAHQLMHYDVLWHMICQLLQLQLYCLPRALYSTLVSLTLMLSQADRPPCTQQTTCYCYSASRPAGRTHTDRQIPAPLPAVPCSSRSRSLSISVLSSLRVITQSVSQSAVAVTVDL